MKIRTFNIGENVWTMDENCPKECTILGIEVNCFFGNERRHEGDDGRIQFFKNRMTIETGVTYTLIPKDAKLLTNKIKKIHLRCFKTKEELLKSL